MDMLHMYGVGIGENELVQLDLPFDDEVMEGLAYDSQTDFTVDYEDVCDAVQNGLGEMVYA